MLHVNWTRNVIQVENVTNIAGDNWNWNHIAFSLILLTSFYLLVLSTPKQKMRVTHKLNMLLQKFYVYTNVKHYSPF